MPSAWFSILKRAGFEPRTFCLESEINLKATIFQSFILALQSLAEIAALYYFLSSISKWATKWKCIESGHTDYSGSMPLHSPSSFCLARRIAASSREARSARSVSSCSLISSQQRRTHSTFSTISIILSCGFFVIIHLRF